MPREDADRHEANDRLAIEAGRPLEFEENSLLDGRSITWLTTKFPLRDAEGKIYAVAGISTDISERKRIEEKLKRYSDELELRVRERTTELRQALEDLSSERRRLYDVFEALPAMICLLTPDHRVGFANRSFREKFGEPQGRYCYQQCFDFQKPCSFCESFKVLETGEPHQWEVVTPDGSIIAVHNFPFMDVDGSPVVLEMDIDITEQRRLEQQLRQAQKMEAIGTLAGGIAHDFNNMLAVIIGNAELALDDLQNGGGYEIEQILKASSRARDLVKQILTFSRKNETRKRPLHLIPIIRESFEFLRGSIPSTVQMQIDIRSGYDTVLADPAQVQQILVNLVSNSAHAMREDGGSLCISLSEELFADGDPAPDAGMQPGKYLNLAVRDSGTGMSTEVCQRVFEPFFTTKEPGQGTGMGLAVVFGIVRSLGGAITVESKLGRGSTFNVFLPVCEQTAEHEEHEEDSLLKGKGHILVVDDERSVLDVVSATLRRLGYNVTTADSGPEGWERFKSAPDEWDLVITDHAMPDITGMRLAEKMLDVRGDIPLILFSGYSETVSPEKAKEAGIGELLMKPVTGKELARAVRRVLLPQRSDDLKNR